MGVLVFIHVYMSGLVEFQDQLGHTYPSANNELVINDTNSRVFRAEVQFLGFSGSLDAKFASISQFFHSCISCDGDRLAAFISSVAKTVTGFSIGERCTAFAVYSVRVNRRSNSVGSGKEVQ